MNKEVIKFLLLLVIQYLIVLVHLILINLLPHPFSHFNVALCFLILFVILTVRPQSLWFALPFIFFESLFSTLPFGVNLLALTLSIITFSSFLMTFLSNRSLPTIIFSSVVFVFFYRILLWLIPLFISIFLTIETINLSSEWWINLFWEILFTTIITSAIYLFLSLFLKRLRPEYITAIQKEYESKRYFR